MNKSQFKFDNQDEYSRSGPSGHETIAGILAPTWQRLVGDL